MSCGAALRAPAQAESASPGYEPKKESEPRSGDRLTPQRRTVHPREKNDFMGDRNAALPQHMAVSLRLTVSPFSNLLRLRLCFLQRPDRS